MLDIQTKRRIDSARDILVGKVPDPKSQVEQITIALIYKFMDDMDAENEDFGGERAFFAGAFARFGWTKLMRPGVSGAEMIALYSEAIDSMPKNPGIPQLFRDIFKNAYLPYRDPETLKSFLKIINEFQYDHSEKLGDAFEYLLSVLGSQGDAGQFRTPRHIIDFIVEIIDPKKDEVILDPACGTAGFLISAYKHILRSNRDKSGQSKLTPDDKERLAHNLIGYDISPDMVRLSLVNLYLHGFTSPQIEEYDTLTSEDNWNKMADVILANPPFMSPKGGIKPHKRFTVTSNRSEVLFVDYMAEHLSPKGRAGIIVPEGVIFQSGTAYKALRKMLVENYLVAVISLPAGVFNPYSNVKTSILIFDKVIAKQSDTIAFFKIENDGFELGAQRREIEKDDLPQVKDEINEYLSRRRAGELIEDFSPTLGHVVPKAKVYLSGDYSLSGERYRENEKRNYTFPLVAISEVCELNPRKSELKGLPDETIVSFVPMADLQEHNISFEAHEIKKLSEVSNSYTYFRNGDVLLAKVTPCFENGKAGVAANLANGIGFGSSEFYVLRANEQVMAKWIYSCVTHPIFRKSAISQMTGTGGLQRVPRSMVEKFRIPLPPLDVQQEVVTEIEGYQKVIDGARTVLENYRPHIPIKSDWPVINLGEICSFKNGLNFTRDQSKYKIKIIGVSDFNGNLYAPTKNLNEISVESPLTDEYLLKTNDILFVRSNGNPDLVGRSLIVPDIAGQISFSGFTIRGRLEDERTFPLFYAYLFKSRDFANMIKSVGQGASIRNLSQKILNEIQVPLPPIETQKQIVAEIEAEQRLVAGNRELIEHFEKKIQATIARVWGEDEVKNEDLLPAEATYTSEQWQDAVGFYLAYHLQADSNFMRTKFQKLLYFAEATYQLPLEGNYERQAAGPLDTRMIYPLEKRAAEKNWFHTKPWEGNGKSGVHYQLGTESEKALAESLKILGDKTADLDRLIEIFKGCKTETAEKVATLFAAWNDFLLQGKEPADEEILDEVLNNWHDSKKKISRDDWSKALSWMKREKFVPTGEGPRTKGKVAPIGRSSG